MSSDSRFSSCRNPEADGAAFVLGQGLAWGHAPRLIGLGNSHPQLATADLTGSNQLVLDQAVVG